MKKIFTLLFLSVILISFPSTTHAEFTKNKIAVLDFMLQGKGFETKDLGQIVAEWLITALVQEGRFDVIERRLLKKIIEEQQLSESGILDQKTTAELGKVLGVKVVVSGSVMQIQDVIEVNSRIIDVKTGSILAAESVRSNDANQLNNLVEQMAKKIIKAFPLEGYIVNRREKQVTIDLGRFSGVKSGMNFIVYREGKVIKHPKTGEVLDVLKIQTGLISICKVSEKLSECSIINENTPNAIQYGQLVKSTSKRMKDTHLSDNTKMASDLNKTKTKKGVLFIDVVPHDSEVKILNIKPKYYRGIGLPPGNYKLEISAPDYKIRWLWVNLLPGEEKHVSVILEKRVPINETRDKPEKEKQTQSSINPRKKKVVAKKQPENTNRRSNKNFKYLNMLGSDKYKTKVNSAKIIFKRKLFDPEILQAVNDELLNGFQKKTRDRYHIDCMAWFCKILGASKQTQYKKTLVTVGRKSSSRKIKKYANWGLKQLK